MAIRKILAYTAGGIAIVVVGVLGVAATKPDVFRVARDATIKAPPEKILPLIADLRGGFSTWSPYELKDPGMKRSFTGPTSGKGAAYAWDGNGEVGSGRMEIAEATPDKVTIKLEFTRPFEARNTVEFIIEPKADATRVTWAMQGPVPYVAKVMHVIFDMDHMVGRDFEAGLAKLKSIAER